MKKSLLETGMPVRENILRKLAASRNLSVEWILESALLANPPASEQEELFEIAATRNKRSGWVGFIKAYDRLSAALQGRLVERKRELFGALSEAMQEIEGPTRSNVLEIVRLSGDRRLCFLLAQALIDLRPEVRESAGRSLLAVVSGYRGEPMEQRLADNTHEVEESGELRRAVDYAMRQFKTHRQPTALLAALIFERQQDAPLWSHFQDPYEELTKAAAAILRNPPATAGPLLAAATLLALASPLKPAAVAGLSSTEDAVMGRALIGESFRLVDPVLREVTQGIGHLKILPALWKAAPATLETWAQWLRMIDAAGLQPVEKVTWLGHLMEKSQAAGAAALAWKLSIIRTVADIGTPDAGRLLARLVSDPDERAAKSACRCLLSRRHTEWRGLAAGTLSPHVSVRRMVGTVHISGSGKTGILTVTERVNAVVGPAGSGGGEDPGFGRVWGEHAQMPAAVQHSTARAAAQSDPDFIDQMKAKLASSVTAEVGQGLKMIGVLPNLAAYRAQIINLCGHVDVRVAAAAVKLVGRLEDPRLKDLLEAAAQHSDPRVRANAVESMAALHIADRSQRVLVMLESRHNRERANAIRAISEFDFHTARECLLRMVADQNPLHRISALWVVQQLELPDLFRQVSSLARRDPNVRVRKRAAEMVETLTGNIPSEGKVA